MSKVRILPEILSNKIAAGEVVERPASVIKELVENSLDAGSTVINVEVEQGGKSLIRVSDNGYGMGMDDALMAIERYATSKIYTDEDLFSINTLGFRGEALPSIASVSRFTIVTREQNSDSAAEIYIEGGNVKKVTETGAPPGTMVTVGQLFFNTPARRKFMKSAGTEMGHITDTIASIALGWPKVHFRLTHNKKAVKSWPGTEGSFNRAVDVLGNDLKNGLHEIRFEDNYLKINGWTSSPDITRSTSNRIYTYINGRYIKDRKILHALIQGYGLRLMKGRFPLGVIFIDIPFDQLDINVHPTKHEVRFADHKRVFDSVKAIVSDTINATERSKWRSAKETVPVTRHDNRTEKEQFVSESIEAEGFKQDEKRQAESDMAIMEAPIAYIRSGFEEADKRIEPERPLTAEERFSSAGHEKLLHADNQENLWKKSFFTDLAIIGQLRNTYILCDSRDGLIIIDQHAAHERIVYEKLKKKQTRVESQTLLIPETVELGYREAVALEKIIDDLAALGLEIEPFGGNTFTVRSVPPVLSGGSVAALVTEIAEKLISSGHTETLKDVLNDCLIIMACHGAIRANQALNEKQLRHLLIQMDACEIPSFCPHGRPTWIRWSYQKLEKSFRRQV